MVLFQQRQIPCAREWKSSMYSLHIAQTCEHRLSRHRLHVRYYSHKPCALRAGIFWKQILQSDAHSTSNAMKGKHRLHEPMVQPRKPTSSGRLVTIVPTPVSMVSVSHAAAAGQHGFLCQCSIGNGRRTSEGTDFFGR